jgi:hypothetical protein
MPPRDRVIYEYAKLAVFIAVLIAVLLWSVWRSHSVANLLVSLRVTGGLPTRFLAGLPLGGRSIYDRRVHPGETTSETLTVSRLSHGVPNRPKHGKISVSRLSYGR